MPQYWKEGNVTLWLLGNNYPARHQPLPTITYTSHIVKWVRLQEIQVSDPYRERSPCRLCGLICIERDCPSPKNVPPSRRHWGAAGRAWSWGWVPGRTQCCLSPDRFHSLSGWRPMISEPPTRPLTMCLWGPDSSTEPLNPSCGMTARLGWVTMSCRPRQLWGRRSQKSLPPANAVMKLWSKGTFEGQTALELRILFF